MIMALPGLFPCFLLLLLLLFYTIFELVKFTSSGFRRGSGGSFELPFDSKFSKCGINLINLGYHIYHK